MPLLENLAEGLANAAGATGAVSAIEKRKSERQALSQEELKANLDLYNQALSSIQQKMGTVEPGSPEYEKLHDALAKTISARTALFHPQYGPSAMTKLAEMLHLKRPSAPAAAGITPAAALEAGVSAPARPEAKTEKPPHYTDYTASLRRFVEAEGGDPDHPTAAEEEAFRKQRIGEKTKPTAISKFQTEVNAYRTTHKIPEDEPLTEADISYINQKAAHDARVAGSSTAVRFEKNDKNELVPVEYTNYRGVGPEPVDPRANSIPKTPGEAKKVAARTAPKSNIKVGDPLMRVANPATNKLEGEYNEAVKLASLADQVAAKPSDAINQKRLAVALEKVSAGRFTTQALDYIIKAGWGNTIQQWINNPSTGALPKDVMRQLVDGAHENLKAAKDALDAARRDDTGNGSQPPPGAKIIKWDQM